MSAPNSDAPIASNTLARNDPRSLADSHGLTTGGYAEPEPEVTTLGDAGSELMPVLRTVLERFGITLHLVPQAQTIPGSFWGDPEAGLVGAELYARTDTPVHSVLHEACHYICMDPRRRTGLHTDAGGTSLEECGVCYLSILLADWLPDFGRARMLEDMDRWGYSFRLGSSAAWFDDDADDALQWLQAHALVDAQERVTWKIRSN